MELLMKIILGVAVKSRDTGKLEKMKLVDFLEISWRK